MRTTVDIPDPLYRHLKSTAALRGCSVKDLILPGVNAELEHSKSTARRKRVRLPMFESKSRAGFT